jgi:hypothetical protein
MQGVRQTIWVLASNILIVLALLVTIDLIVSNSSLRFKLIPDSFRIPDTRIHHTLEKNVSAGLAIWGAARYAFSTNSLGFRDSTVRVVKLAPEKSVRVLFLGDSFTEGVGLPWEKTFVGIFQSHFPGVEVLNAGVIGYSPSIYLRQVERLLSNGFLTTHVIVYIDISDVQDEALYKFDEEGNVVDSGFVVNPFARVSDPKRFNIIALPAQRTCRTGGIYYCRICDSPDIWFTRCFTLARTVVSMARIGW